MTTTPVPPSDQPMLPGLEPPRAAESELVKAARRTLAALAGDLDERHALPMAMILAQADAMESGRRSGKAAAVAMASAELRATWELLFPDQQAGGDEVDAFAALANELADDMRRAAEDGHAAQPEPAD